ncbi:neuromedin-U receptor 1 [Sigmodon hispidus]
MQMKSCSSLASTQIQLFVPICITYLLIFVVGTVGNVLTCTVILHHKAMKTPTNFYLLSLAVSDLLVLLVGLPLELYEMQHNHPFQLGASGCYFRTLLFETVCLASVLNVTALSVERYVAVVHPLQAKTVMTRAHVRRMLGAIWVLAVLFSLPNTSLHGIKQLYVPCRGLVPDSAVCTLVRPRVFYNLVVQTTTLFFFCLPMVTISMLYLLIGLQLRRERMLIQEEVQGRKTSALRKTYSRRLQLRDGGRRQVTKMLSNPVLYSLMSSRFRETFRQALGLGTQCRRRHQSCHGSHNLSRLNTGSTLYDLGSRNSRAEPLTENGDPGFQQKTDPC